MYIASFVLILIVSLVFVAQVQLITLTTLVLLTGVVIYLLVREGRTRKVLQRVARILYKQNRSLPREERLLEDLKSRLWQVESDRILGEEFSRLAMYFDDIFQELRVQGISALSGLPERLKHVTRADSVVVYCEESSAKIHYFQEQASRVYVPSRWIIKELQEKLPPLQTREISNDEYPEAQRWIGNGSFVFTYQSMAPDGNQTNACDVPILTVLLGYRSDMAPLPREHDILVEVAQRAARALREFFVVSAVQTRGEEERLQQEKFFAHVSHDIRTPLNNIQAILDLFFLEGVSPKNENFLKVARANCRSLRDIVEELLEFTKVKNGYVARKVESIVISDIVHEVVSEFALSAESKGLMLDSKIVGTPIIEGDRKQIKRILMNLVSNGLKYTHQGGVTIRSFNSGNQVQIDVVDSGQGIPEERMKELFVPFSRLDACATDGIGLGLVLTQLLVEQNKGQIRVSSQFGRGSKFSMVFQASSAHSDVMSSALRSQEEREAELSLKVQKLDSEGERKVRVILVDDDADASRSLATLLRRFSLEVYATSTVKELKELLVFWSPEVVVTDIQMPNGGIEAVKASVSNFKEIEIIALTGCVDSARLNQVRDLGVSVILKKPARPETLIAAIHDAASQVRGKGSRAEDYLGEQGGSEAEHRHIA